MTTLTEKGVPEPKTRFHFFLKELETRCLALTVNGSKCTIFKTVYAINYREL